MAVNSRPLYQLSYRGALTGAASEDLTRGRGIGQPEGKEPYYSIPQPPSHPNGGPSLFPDAELAEDGFQQLLGHPFACDLPQGSQA